MPVKRGRPQGYKLSEESKDKIRQSRIGQIHDNEIKIKISNSLKRYFKTEEGKKAIAEMSVRWKAFYKTDEGCNYRNERSLIMKELWNCDCGIYKQILSDHYKKGPKLMWKNIQRKRGVNYE